MVGMQKAPESLQSHSSFQGLVRSPLRAFIWGVTLHSPAPASNYQLRQINK